MKPVFCGNFEYDAREGDLERLFGKHGKVDRVDMKAALWEQHTLDYKPCIFAVYVACGEAIRSLPSAMAGGKSERYFCSGFAFEYIDNERDAEDAIQGLDRIEFGRKGRRLRVEWTKGERGGDRRSGGGDSRISSSSMRPSKTLFVINFDAENTRTRDLERHFEPYGKIVNVRIRRNFAFVQYEEHEDATRALAATNNMLVLRDALNGEGGHPVLAKRKRGSPDYGRGGSPVAAYRKERTSPGYGRRRSPSPPYKRSRRGSPEYGESPRRRERNSRSPDNKRKTLKKESPSGEVESPTERRGRWRLQWC
uniref:RRM domain-containing protein n=1 Tax=Brassica oleracea TaxID=3712 RepID=A0A3P6EWB4_BRAOL|nr:unnamed protein product [Brassica oleracea]